MQSELQAVWLEREAGSSGWALLEQAGWFDIHSVQRAWSDCIYDPLKVASAFYPVALLHRGSNSDLTLPDGGSQQEQVCRNEKFLKDLSAGRVQLSTDARAALGDGYSAELLAGTGLPLLELMEIATDTDAVVLGWGWVWHRKEPVAV